MSKRYLTWSNNWIGKFCIVQICHVSIEYLLLVSWDLTIDIHAFSKAKIFKKSKWKNTKQRTCSIIGNCPKFKFSLITGPLLYWKQTSAVNFPAYVIFACLHCSKKKMQQQVKHWIKKKICPLKKNQFWNLLRMEVRLPALSSKFAPSEADITPDYPTNVRSKLRTNTNSIKKV